MKNHVNVAIELYDGWRGKKGIAWRKGVTLHYRGNGEAEKLGIALETKLEQIAAMMAKDGLDQWWYSYQIGALLISLSQDVESTYKCVPRLQPRLDLPQNTDYLYAVFLGPEKGTFAIEGYRVTPTPDSHGVIQQFAPVSWQSPAQEAE